MKKLLYSLSLVLIGTLAQAQVKIGSNPGTIGSSSNLEVEATNGNKTIIDKTTGLLNITGTFSDCTIKIDGVKRGMVTDTALVLTADGYIKKAPPATAPLIRVVASMSQSKTQTYPPGSTIIDFTSLDFESYPGTTDLVGNRMIIPRAGYYQINGTVGLTDGPAGSTLDACVYYMKNGVIVGENCIRNGSNNGRQSGSFSTVLYLNQNDYISVRIDSNSSTTFGSKAIVSPSSLQIFELR